MRSPGGAGGGSAVLAPALVVLVGALAALPRLARVGEVGPDPAPPTWSGSVASLVYANCVECHRTGGPAPFSLLSYRDAASRAERIAAATARGYMPPWLPAAGVEELAGERRLDEDEIELLGQWARAGAPAGEMSAAPEPPSFSGEWSLGEPDLIVTFPEYAVPAEGRDVYRTFVVTVPGDEARWIKAAELRFGDTRVVHHARMLVDSTTASREQAMLDLADELDVMRLAGSAHNPHGFFVGWAPGTSPNPGREDLAWRLAPGTDLVLQLHLRPTGRPESVEPRVGFHLASAPPREAPALVLLESRDIDLQPGDTAFAAEDRFRLPVEVEVLGVYPHAHYLGKRIEAWAVLPNGRRRDLLRIDDWDFNFQDQYRYRRPVRLPAGSVLSMRVTFDNSADNPHNPFDPPRRVVRGLASTDEMAEVGFQVLPTDPEDLATLVQGLDRFYYAAELRWEAAAILARARTFEAEGRLDEALEEYRRALLMGDDADIMASMAAVLIRQGEGEAAVFVARRAAALSAGADPGVLGVLARAFAAAGDTAQARDVANRAREIADRLGQDAVADSLAELTRRLGGGTP